jgi:hypothetical protein
MIDLGLIRDIVTIFGVIAGFSYYVLTVRNANKARQVEMLHRLHDSKYDVEGIERFFQLTNLEWDDFNDYFEKYSAMNNPKMAAIMESQMSFFEGLGVIVKKQVIDLDTVYDIFSNRIISLWLKYETVVKGWRKTVEYGPGAFYCENFENLADEMIKIRKKRGTSFPLRYIHPTSTLHKEFNP